jgi:hypothetical protein
MTPSGKDFIRLFSRKSLGTKMLKQAGQGLRPLTWGKPLAINNGFATEAIWWSSFRAFGQHLRDIVDGEEIITAQ